MNFSNALKMAVKGVHNNPNDNVLSDWPPENVAFLEKICE
jgi:hypothetical protein